MTDQPVPQTGNIIHPKVKKLLMFLIGLTAALIVIDFLIILNVFDLEINAYIEIPVFTLGVCAFSLLASSQLPIWQEKT